MDQVVGSDWLASYYGYDGKGSVRQLYDQYGTVTDTYDYDAFGNLIAHTGSTYNNYQYTGEQFDADLGLYYLRARYHNPNSGRMWTMDSFEGFATDPQSLHKYTFNHNDPVNRRDPSGHMSMVEMSLVSGLAPLVRMTLDHIETGVYNFSHGQAGGSELKAKSHEEALYIDSLGAGAGGLAMGRSNFYNTQRGAPFLLGFNIPWSNYPRRTGCAFELITGDNGDFAIYGCPSKDPLFQNTYDPELLATADSIYDAVSGLYDVGEIWEGFKEGLTDVFKGLSSVPGGLNSASDMFATGVKGAAGWVTAQWDEDLAYSTYGNEMASVAGAMVKFGTISGAAFDTMMYAVTVGPNPALAEAKYAHGPAVMMAELAAMGGESQVSLNGAESKSSSGRLVGNLISNWVTGKALAKVVAGAVRMGARAKAVAASKAMALANAARKIPSRARAAMAAVGPKLTQCVTTVKRAISPPSTPRKGLPMKSFWDQIRSESGAIFPGKQTTRADRRKNFPWKGLERDDKLLVKNLGGRVANHTPHHLIGVAEAENYAVMRRAEELGYNINRTNNGINLPNDPSLAKQLNLPYHPQQGRHTVRTYTGPVNERLQELQDAWDAGVITNADLLDEITAVENSIRKDLLNGTLRLNSRYSWFPWSK